MRIEGFWGMYRDVASQADLSPFKAAQVLDFEEWKVPKNYHPSVRYEKHARDIS